MARKKSDTKPYRVKLSDRITHTVTPRKFKLWAQLGLIVMVSAKLGRPAANTEIFFESDKQLQLAPSGNPGPRVFTNSQQLDRAYVFAHAGQVLLPKGLEQDLRLRYGKEAARYLDEIRRTERERQVALQYGW